MGRRRDIVLPFLAFCAPLAVPAWARPCDDACFPIQDTFGHETLRRRLQAFPEGRYAALAGGRPTCLDDLRRLAACGGPDAFGPVHRVPTVPVHTKGVSPDPAR